MTFEDVLNEALAMLQRQRRVAYGALKRQFELETDYLEDLKEAILYAYPQVVTDEGRGLVWIGDPAPPEPDARRRAEAEGRFHLVEEIREELTFRRLAIDEGGKVSSPPRKRANITG